MLCRVCKPTNKSFFRCRCSLVANSLGFWSFFVVCKQDTDSTQYVSKNTNELRILFLRWFLKMYYRCTMPPVLLPNLTQTAFLRLPILTSMWIKNKARFLWKQNLASEEGDEKLIITSPKNSVSLNSKLRIISNRTNSKNFFKENVKNYKKLTLFLWGIKLLIVKK